MGLAEALRSEMLRSLLAPATMVAVKHQQGVLGKLFERVFERGAHTTVHRGTDLARYFQPAVGTADAVSPRLAPAGVTCLSSARSA